MAVRTDLVGLVDPAALARTRAEHLAGVVEQGDVSGGPLHVVDRLAALAVQRLVLAVFERFAGGEPQERHRPEQVVEQLGRGEHRPHPVQRSAHLRQATHLTAHLGGRGVAGAPRQRHRREHLALDELAAGVVAPVPPTGLLDDVSRIGDGEPHVAGAVRHHQILAEGALAVGDRVVDHVAHPCVALDLRRER